MKNTPEIVSILILNRAHILVRKMAFESVTLETTVDTNTFDSISENLNEKSQLNTRILKSHHFSWTTKLFETWIKNKLINDLGKIEDFSRLKRNSNSRLPE